MKAPKPLCIKEEITPNPESFTPRVDLPDTSGIEFENNIRRRYASPVGGKQESPIQMSDSAMNAEINVSNEAVQMAFANDHNIKHISPDSEMVKCENRYADLHDLAEIIQSNDILKK